MTNAQRRKRHNRAHAAWRQHSADVLRRTTRALASHDAHCAEQARKARASLAESGLDKNPSISAWLRSTVTDADYEKLRVGAMWAAREYRVACEIVAGAR